MFLLKHYSVTVVLIENFLIIKHYTIMVFTDVVFSCSALLTLIYSMRGGMFSVIRVYSIGVVAKEITLLEISVSAVICS